MATPITNLIFARKAGGIRNVKDGRFFPLRSVILAGGESLPSKPNVRYFIDRILISYTTLVTDAGTSVTVTEFQDSVPVTLAKLIKTTLVVNQVNQAFHCEMLLNVEKALLLTAADITAASAVVTYAAVDDLG